MLDWPVYLSNTNQYFPDNMRQMPYVIKAICVLTILGLCHIMEQNVGLTSHVPIRPVYTDT